MRRWPVAQTCNAHPAERGLRHSKTSDPAERDPRYESALRERRYKFRNAVLG